MPSFCDYEPFKGRIVHSCSVPFVVMMHECSPHADPLGVYQTCTVGMMLECSTGDLLVSAAFMHHNDPGHDALKNYLCHP